MILARISRAIREQNWFAVAIEFVIVISGVVIGFQVTAWNADRQAAEDEARIIERLHADIVNVGNDRWDWAADRVSTRDLLLTASEKLFGDVADELTLAECNALAQSRVFNSPSLALPILSELESTGELDLISNRNIRSAITGNFLANIWSQEIDTAINREIFNLSARHAAYFHFVLPDNTDNWNPIFDGSARCDTTGMRDDTRFLNELADNISKSRYFMNAVLTGPNESFEALHRAVDTELGLSHASEEATP